MNPDIFNCRKQLVFYGAYHNNPTNVRIHMIFVPLIVWSAEVLLTALEHAWFLPQITYRYTPFLAFDLNFATIYAALNWFYYYMLEPTAALLYLPQYILMLLTATSFGLSNPNAVPIALSLQALSWTMQFLGHGLAERRAPALLNNLVGALVLAPFFVHLEWLFKLGYRPDLHRDIINGIGMEIARIRREEAKAAEIRAKSF